MNVLVSIWSLSLITLLLVIFFALYAFRRGSTVRVFHHNVESFVTYEFNSFLGAIHKSFHSIRPHAERFGMVAFERGKNGYDIFIERIFGKVEIEKGKAASFFLKHIAEHKGMIVRDYKDPIMK